MTRTLRWDGCCNIRDLGGLPTEDGAETRFRVVVRADDVTLLSRSGWDALAAYGVTRIVDLRHEHPPYERPVPVVRMPLLDDVSILELDQLLSDVDDPVEWRRRNYLFLLDRFHERFAAAVAAVAESDGTVLVHCAGGVDRTGLVAALMLRLAGVGIDTVSADYAESEANWAGSVAEWVAEARDEAEARTRRLLSQMPAAAMHDTLTELERSHGTAREYLVAGGADAAALERLRERLRA